MPSLPHSRNEYWVKLGLVYECQAAAKVSEQGDSPVTGRLVIWRVGPGEYVIRSESPGDRDGGARFRLVRDRCAKFAERAS